MGIQRGVLSDSANIGDHVFKANRGLFSPLNTFSKRFNRPRKTKHGSEPSEFCQYALPGTYRPTSSRRLSHCPRISFCLWALSCPGVCTLRIICQRQDDMHCHGLHASDRFRCPDVAFASIPSETKHRNWPSSAIKKGWTSFLASSARFHRRRYSRNWFEQPAGQHFQRTILRRRRVQLYFGAPFGNLRPNCIPHGRPVSRRARLSSHTDGLL